MHLYKVAAVLFVGTAFSLGQLDISRPESGLGTLPSGGNDQERASPNGTLSVSLYNNLANGTYAYVIGKDVYSRTIILQPDGIFFYPDANGATAPVKVTQDVKLPLGALGSTFSIDIPAFISSARIYFAVGELQLFIVSVNGEISLIEPSAIDPADPYTTIQWGFIEFTYISTGVWANISNVDFVGLPLGISLISTTGSVQSAAGLATNAITSICNDLDAQATKDGQPWNKLCQISSTGTALRILAPINYINEHPNAFNSYWTDYINQVWSAFVPVPLIIDTQMSTGKVLCQVSGDVLNCAGDNRGY